VFTEEVLARLGRRDDLDVTAYSVTWSGRGGLGAVVPEGVRLATRPMAARPLREAWRRADVPPIEWWTGPVDVVHGPNFVVPPARHAARVVTVHDLTPVRFPELCTSDTLAYPGLIRRALRGGAWIHTPSQFVADEVVAAFGADPARVVAIPNGVTEIGPDVTGRDAAEGVRLAGSERYLLTIGTIEPRKDLPWLVDAFDVLAANHRDVSLVVAGPDGWGVDDFDRAVARATHRARIVRLGWVGPDHRAALLRGATALAYPSRYEGFGLPPLEAMAAGVAVVATDAGALPEVLGDAADLVPVGADLAPTVRADALADALARVLDDDAHRARLVTAGRERAAAYSWDTTTARLVDLYRLAVG
jgi:glycosyltransferase involved in cell wall biosynthesis